MEKRRVAAIHRGSYAFGEEKAIGSGIDIVIVDTPSTGKTLTTRRSIRLSKCREKVAARVPSNPSQRRNDGLWTFRTFYSATPDICAVEGLSGMYRPPVPSSDEERTTTRRTTMTLTTVPIELFDLTQDTVILRGAETYGVSSTGRLSSISCKTFSPDEPVKNSGSSKYYAVMAVWRCTSNMANIINKLYRGLIKLASNKRICIVSHSFVDFCLACK